MLYIVEIGGKVVEYENLEKEDDNGNKDHNRREDHEVQ